MPLHQDLDNLFLPILQVLSRFKSPVGLSIPGVTDEQQEFFKSFSSSLGAIVQQTEAIERGAATDTDRQYFARNIKYVIDNIPRLTSLITDLSNAGLVDESKMGACSSSLAKLEVQLKTAASLGRSLPPLTTASSSSSRSDTPTTLPPFSPIHSTPNKQDDDGNDSKRRKI